jgi:hypothetical protein
MKLRDCPISVMVIAILYIAVGVITSASHFHTLLQHDRDSILVELVECTAIVTGIFLLLGRNWARWLAIAWALFHVGVSFADPKHQLAGHLVIAAGIIWLLLRRDASDYFHAQKQT